MHGEENGEVHWMMAWLNGVGWGECVLVSLNEREREMIRGGVVGGGAG